jgi:hypothetical protein
VQQWADHWCGNTWSELLLPRHPTDELKRTIVSRLVTLGVLQGNEGSLSTGPLWETVQNAKQALFNILSSETIDEVDTELLFRVAILGQLCGNQILRGKEVAWDLQKVDRACPFNSLKDEVKTVILQGQAYLAQYKA